MEEVLILHGGGVDSLVVLATLAAEPHGVEVRALHVDYGQPSYEKELEAVEAQMDRYYPGRSIYRVSVELPIFNLNHEAAPAPGYIPSRNLALLAVAASWAEALLADYIAVGFHVTDMPDCSNYFITKFLGAVWEGSRYSLGMFHPLSDLTKAEVYAKGESLGVDWNLGWSCFTGNMDACGECPGCIRRSTAGIPPWTR